MIDFQTNIRTAFLDPQLDDHHESKISKNFYLVYPVVYKNIESNCFASFKETGYAFLQHNCRLRNGDVIL